MTKTTSSKPATGTTTRRAAVRAKAPAEKPVRARRAVAGDIAPSKSARGIESYAVDQAVEAAETAKLTAVRDILSKKGNGDIMAHGKALRFREARVRSIWNCMNLRQRGVTTPFSMSVSEMPNSSISSRGR